jgi:hypothetical protein
MISTLNKNTNLIDLVKVYKSIPEKVCNNVIKRSSTFSWEKHQWSGYNSTHTQNNNDAEFLRSSMDPLSKLELYPKINDIFGQYIEDVSSSYMFKIEGFSPPLLNRYDIGTKMSLHQDHIYSLFNGTVKGIPILSAVGLLNNDFEGGEFVLWGDEIIKLDTGDIIVFPSLFAYPHHVNTVTKGSRYSVVSWAH